MGVARGDRQSLGVMNTGWGQVFTFPCMRILMVREGGSAEVFIRFAMVRRSVGSQVSSETVLNKQQLERFV